MAGIAMAAMAAMGMDKAGMDKVGMDRAGGMPAAGWAPISLPTAPAIPSSGIAVTPFAGVLSDAIGSVNQLEAQAKTSIEGLISGSGVDLHEAMIATEKAEMGFELALGVRNKALAAYQQVMGMQF